MVPKWVTALNVIAFCMVSAAVSPSHGSEDKVVVAHRGASGYLPEHTLAAKAMAHAMGADYLEQDVVLTADAVPVVLHDITLEAVTNVAERFPDRRSADGRFYVADFTLAEIKTLTLGERVRPDSGEQRFPGRFAAGRSAFTIPTLAEEIELIQGLNRTTGRTVGVFPEIKAPTFHRERGLDSSRAVLAVLADYGYRDRSDPVILQTFDWAEAQRIRTELGYAGRLVQLLGENGWGLAPGIDFDHLKTPEGLREIAAIADGIGPWINQVIDGTDPNADARPTALVSDAKAAGLIVYPYTVRADALPPWAESHDALLETVLFDAGADGVFTDFPDLAVRFLQSRH